MKYRKESQINKSTSRGQGRSREAGSERSRRQTRGATNRNIVKGLGSGAKHLHMAKPIGSGSRVNGALVRGKLMSLSGEASAPRVPSLTGSSRVGNDDGGNRGVSRRHSSCRERAGSSRRRVTRPTNELEVSTVTKARTKIMSASPFARSTLRHRQVHRVVGAKRVSQTQPKGPPAKWVIRFYPTTVR